MKKIASFLSVACLLAGCSGFLDEVDKDKLIPTTTEHYAAVLLNEFANQQAVFAGAEFMSDDISEYEYTSESLRRIWKPIYTWQLEIEITEEGRRVDNNNVAWRGMYEDISVANYVIELIDEAIGSQQQRDFVKGEAYFVRAYSFFELANLYATPYKPATATVDLGIPLRIDNGIQQTYNRASLAETYTQIIADLMEARHLIGESGIVKSKFHPTVSVCDLLLSRVYLYMQEWEKAVEFASEVIKNNKLSRMTASQPYATAAATDILYSSQVIRGSSDETIFEKGWRVNNELIDLYHTDDIRLDAFFVKIAGSMGRVYYPRKRTGDFTSLGNTHLRVAEAYLNRAEANYKLKNDAADDLKTFMESRYRNKTSVVILTGDALYEQILTERRKEFCFEGHHRWFDLRRMENRPVIIHDYTLTDADGTSSGVQRYTLLSDDMNYTLPLPLAERDNNPLIRNNERYDKLPENL